MLSIIEISKGLCETVGYIDNISAFCPWIISNIFSDLAIKQKDICVIETNINLREDGTIINNPDLETLEDGFYLILDKIYHLIFLTTKKVDDIIFDNSVKEVEIIKMFCIQPEKKTNDPSVTFATSEESFTKMIDKGINNVYYHEIKTLCNIDNLGLLRIYKDIMALSFDPRIFENENNMLEPGMIPDTVTQVSFNNATDYDFKRTIKKGVLPNHITELALCKSPVVIEDLDDLKQLDQIMLDNEIYTKDAYKMIIGHTQTDYCC